eukprot:CAMPEP_0201520152 /NCGR_PEP_ID=MMETSP0161_2-20130828/10523_1 /ASSEMBLY_ACC=CAM_ASM_000251 /TAXON_ID=180227 /ORGANISM="Neoparamoeba aestuarina, Strain SoJaBio B1-5/56/2" /LENGTH=160 /DNA_ID=CAMNT_0047918425 /DNA_START=156 /DNA_END=638 /DNA_ORIENTATION=-
MAMQAAVEQAQFNPSAPFGAVIFDCVTGEIVARGHNECISYMTHGEIMVINHYTQQCNAHRDNETVCTSNEYNVLSSRMGLASTGAPCSMCSSAIAWMGFGRVIYGSNYTYLAEYQWQPLVPTQQQILDGFNVNPYSKDVSVKGNVRSDLTDPMFIRDTN